jgi:hypothetical protein
VLLDRQYSVYITGTEIANADGHGLAKISASERRM